MSYTLNSINNIHSLAWKQQSNNKSK